MISKKPKKTVKIIPQQDGREIIDVSFTFHVIGMAPPIAVKAASMYIATSLNIHNERCRNAILKVAIIDDDFIITLATEKIKQKLSADELLKRIENWQPTL